MCHIYSFERNIFLVKANFKRSRAVKIGMAPFGYEICVKVKMKINFRIKAARAAAFTGLLGVLLLTGCGSSGGSGASSSGVSVGQTLYMSDGTQYGTVVAADEAHQFPNGAVEPGVLVDYGPRIPGQQNWLPTRSAATMVR